MRPNMRDYCKTLLSGKTVRLPDGKRARPTSKARTCPKCNGSKSTVEEMPAACLHRYEESECFECWGHGMVVDIVIEDDPTLLLPWKGAQSHAGAGFAERHRADGRRVAYVENDQGDISIGIEPDGGRSYTIHLEAQFDDDQLPRQRSGDESERLTWMVALRLADAELSNLDRERVDS